MTLDLRFWNDKDGRELISKIRALAQKTWVEGVTQTVEQLSYSPAMPVSENTRALVEKITDAASEAGFDTQSVDAGGTSDGNHMAEAGIPVVDGCGPAGGGFHSEREFLRLETVRGAHQHDRQPPQASLILRAPSGDIATKASDPRDAEAFSCRLKSDRGENF